MAEKKTTDKVKDPRTYKVSELKKKIPEAPILEIAEQGVARQVGGFLTFLRQQGVVGLAVGLVLGGAVSTLVKSLIDNIVTPPLGKLLGSATGLNGLQLAIGQVNGKETYITYGVFLNNFVNFVIIALVIYFVVHILRLDRLDKAKE